MTEPMNKVTLALAEQPGLAEWLARKQPGDECRMEITATLDEADAAMAVLSIKTLKLPGYKPQMKDAETGGESVATEWSRLKPMEIVGS